MKKIILLGVIAVMLLLTASTAMADTIVWQIGVFDDLYGVTDGTKVTTSPDKSTAPTGTVTVVYTDVSTFYSVLRPGTKITGLFTADLSKGAVLLISWSPGKSATEKFSVTLDGMTKLSRTVTGSICTTDPPDGRCGQVPSYYSNLPGLPYYTEIFDFGPVESETETHTLSINYSQGDGIGFDYLKLSTLASPECVTPPLDMVSWWPGDGDAVDIVGNNDGTVYDATFEAGKVGDAFSSFDGGDDRIDLGNPTTLKQAFSHLTIDAWVKPSKNMDYGSVISCTQWDGWAMRIGNGQLIADLRLTGGNVWLNAGTVPLNVWSHVAITYDQSIVRVFINGTEVGNAPGTGTIKNTLNASTNVFIGNEPAGTVVQPSYEFHGDIDEVEIFDRALLQSEIQGIYNAGSAGKCKITNHPPVAVCKDIEIHADENCQAFITPEEVGDESYDPDEGDTIELSVNKLGPYGLGEHSVILTVTDESDEYDTCEAKVTVVDTTPPIIESFTVYPNVLRPPNHKMVRITHTIIARDNCDPEPGFELISITTNEGDETDTFHPDYDLILGDGHTINDIHVDVDGNIYLRAERSGKGTGRIYTITYEVIDASGNSTTATATVTVPHDQK